MNHSVNIPFLSLAVQLLGHRNICGLGIYACALCMFQNTGINTRKVYLALGIYLFIKKNCFNVNFKTSRDKMDIIRGEVGGGGG